MKRCLEKRPWGMFEQFTLNEISTIKILTIKPKQKFSLQYHKSRKEFWRFLDNPAKVTVGKKTFKAKMGDEFIIERKTNHRIEAFSKPVRVLEISFGKFNEKDIVRIEDAYGRK
ncbi:mannose-6-phosphate isomerase [Candidatus Pacearchaeota archaeon CG10_big_fil_rev_8_21_14_0_10_34_76]|nr:MAG: mannose-6-phosphate isomerase [Candidatus Pacearchaeota archaeon CG10_big_fil_rev_8_21_14_0_10_34_76]